MGTIRLILSTSPVERCQGRVAWLVSLLAVADQVLYLKNHRLANIDLNRNEYTKFAHPLGIHFLAQRWVRSITASGTGGAVI